MKRLSCWQNIFRREFLSYFNSPIAYTFIIVFVMFLSGMFMSNFFLIGNADMRYFFQLAILVICVFIPAITMKTWAEEKSGNTFELLLTFPAETYQLVLGKFIAALTFYITAIAGTMFIPLILFMVGKPDAGPIIGGYLGLIFAGAFFLSIGIFVSGLCKDQVVAFIGGMIVCFSFYLLGLDFTAATIDGWIPGLGSFMKEYFGMTDHFTSFAKGVIDGRDIVYFVFMTAIFLGLNIFSLEDRLRPKAKVFLSAAVGICAGIVLMVNFIVSDMPLGRSDLTHDKLYTVTKAARGILKSLKAPVTVKFYISPKEKMPTSFKNIEQDMRDKLDEFKTISNGKLDYKIYHMQTAESENSGTSDKETSLEEKLQTKGIYPFQVQSIEKDEMGIKKIYSAAAIAYKEKKEEIIPNITNQNLGRFEYELMSKIYRLTLEKRPKVVLFAPYEEKRIPEEKLAFLRQFGQNVPPEYREDDYKILESVLNYEEYDVARIRLSEEEPIPEDTDTLIVIEPKDVTERQMYEINRFLCEGGNVIIAYQGYEYDYTVSSMRGIEILPRKLSGGVDVLLEGYGVSLNKDTLMDERMEILSVTKEANSPFFSVSAPVKAPMQIMVNQDTMNQGISITSRLNPLFYLWGSALDTDDKVIKDNNIKKTVLFTSSDKSWTVPYHPGAFTQADMDIKGHRDSAGPKTLSVLLEGEFPDLYKDKDVPEWKKPEEQDESFEKAEKAKSEEDGTPDIKPGKLLVVGCSRMFENDIAKAGGIVMFFTNCVDTLTLGGDLISIRSHQPVNRAVKEIRAEARLWYRFFAVFFVPILLIVYGTVRMILRKREKEQYIKEILTNSEVLS
ncbi:MAG: Gldg family protein [Candidatus Omnitrophota bacterium]